MPKPRLEDMLALPDVLLADNFNMYFTSAPALNDFDVRSLRIQCQSTALPGRTLEKALVALFGHEVGFGGRNTVTHTFNCTYIETRVLTVHRVFKDWMNLVRNKRSGHGVSKEFYVATARLELLSEAGEPAGVIKLFNMFPEQMPEVNLDGSSTQAIQVPITFHFDDFDWEYADGAGSNSTPIE